MSETIGPGSWVRCVRTAPASEFREGSIYKILSIHGMAGRCNGPPDHACREIAFMLAGVPHPCCSTCFTPIRPSGIKLLGMLMHPGNAMRGHNNGPA
jgi:hypothetical protein